jgi:hypothetical protein
VLITLDVAGGIKGYEGYMDGAYDPSSSSTILRGMDIKPTIKHRKKL